MKNPLPSFDYDNPVTPKPKARRGASPHATLNKVLPKQSRKYAPNHVPTSEREALEIGAKSAWKVLSMMNVRAEHVEDVGQAFLMGVIVCYRGKWDPTRASFSTAAFFWGRSYAYKAWSDTIRAEKGLTYTEHRAGAAGKVFVDSADDWDSGHDPTDHVLGSIDMRNRMREVGAEVLGLAVSETALIAQYYQLTDREARALKLDALRQILDEQE